MHKILVVDDELSIRESFSLILENKYDLHQAASGEAAVKIAADQKIDLAYLDIRMPGMDGIETLKRIKELDPQIEIIMITAVNDVRKASEAVKLGARDYIVKPFDVNHVLKITEQILRRKSILAQGLEAQSQAGKRVPELIGQNEKILEILKIIDNIKKDERVLIAGEAGTEKETVARLIHEKSQRADCPFKAFYLSKEQSPQQIKAALFGRGKGSSTVDLKSENGLFEQLRDGTIFIGNLESLPEEVFETISKLEFSRLGPKSSTQGISKIPLEARLISGTSYDLAAQNKKVFEFFSEVFIQIPPLRERISDLPLLADYFINQNNNRYGLNVKMTASAVEILTNYPWPGNTAELQALLERLVLCCQDSQITPADLPIDLLKENAEAGSTFIASYEKEYIRSVYEKSGKDKEKAATYLGINPFLLETKLQ
jgi:DNA-binding NtrC family response regulator